MLATLAAMTAEQLHARGPLVSAVSVVGIVLVIACSSAPEPQHKRYEDWHELMEHEMRPIQDAFTDELTKDPGDIDYRFIGDWSQRAAYYFTLFSDKNSQLYDEDATERASAQKAQAWLLAIAGAADRKEQATLVRLMGQRAKICTQCHEDPGG